ncbi:MAG: MarR family transcriptional regulator [Gammaproteobacteria bacterium]|nr:MarR family transcriptional regulator [Gammaproteobacteria bacterium]
MASEPLQTARQLMQVNMLLMRSIGARMRQGQERLEPAHVGILMRLGSGEPCSLTELARYQSVRLPTMSKSVALLVQRGWVERWVPETDRRQTMLRLTSEGRKVLTRMKRQVDRHVASVLQPLSASERGQIDVALRVLGKRLAEVQAVVDTPEG